MPYTEPRGQADSCCKPPCCHQGKREGRAASLEHEPGEATMEQSQQKPRAHPIWATHHQQPLPSLASVYLSGKHYGLISCV